MIAFEKQCLIFNIESQKNTLKFGAYVTTFVQVQEV